MAKYASYFIINWSYTNYYNKSFSSYDNNIMGKVLYGGVIIAFWG